MPRNRRGAGSAPATNDEVLINDLPAATVTAYPDGPLVLRGDFSVRDVDGAELCTGGLVALCRCGRSAR